MPASPSTGFRFDDSQPRGHVLAIIDRPAKHQGPRCRVTVAVNEDLAEICHWEEQPPNGLRPKRSIRLRLAEVKTVLVALEDAVEVLEEAGR